MITSKYSREYIADESVDLIYLDPRLIQTEIITSSLKTNVEKIPEAQLTAFEDTWHWDFSAEETYRELVTEAAPKIATMIGALRELVGTNQAMPIWS